MTTDDLLRQAAEELDKDRLVSIIVTARQALGEAGDALELLVLFNALGETGRGRAIEAARDLVQAQQ